ncbi:MAG: hypothetical protein R2883_03465 [Caldisericia bacterium]
MEWNLEYSHLTIITQTTIIKVMAKKFITNWWTLIECFFISYVLSSIVAILILLFTGSELAHWVVKLIISPAFVFLFTLKYYSKEHGRREARRLTLFWTPLFVIFDIVSYVAIAGYSLGWYFWSFQPWMAIYVVFLFVAPLLVDQIRER